MSKAKLAMKIGGDANSIKSACRSGESWRKDCVSRR
jgi:hypothetical protein